MNKLIIISITLVISFFYGCHSSNAFNVEDEMMGSKKSVSESPTKTFWVSLETTSKNAIKKSEDLIATYYSLFYIPQNNKISITKIGGISTKETKITPAKLPTEITTLSEFKGVNIYKLFFKDDRTKEVKSIIEKNAKKIKTVSKSFKVVEDSEKMIYKEIQKHIQEDLVSKLNKTLYGKDFSVTGNFLLVKLYDFKYSNIKKTIYFKFDYLMLNLKKKKVDYAANLDEIEELINTNMSNKNYKNAQKFNDIYKNIVPNKINYYNNAYTISMNLNNKLDALFVLIDQIKSLDDVKYQKEAINKIVAIYKSSLKKRQFRKLSRSLAKKYKKYAKGKINKDALIEFLKNLAIDYTVE